MSVLLSLASCTQDELAEQGTSLPDGMYPMKIASASLAGGAPASRATTDNVWNGETVYVQVVDNYTSGNPQWESATTQTYTVTSSGTMDRTAGGDVYWQASGERKAIRAWYADGDAASAGSLPSTHSVKTDQSSEGYAKSDFLYAGCTSGFADGKSGISLAFYHQVAKVKINVIKGEETPADFTVTGLTINGVAPQGTFTAPIAFRNDNESHYGAWSVTSQTSSITPHAGTAIGDNTLTAYEALVIPQTVNSGTKLFTIKAKGYSDFAYTSTEDNTWEAGTEYTYTITVKGSKLDVSVSSESINWSTNGASGSGKVELS